MISQFQPTLRFSSLLVRPLLKEDFDALFEAASDPLIWVDHPNPERYKKEVFTNFFHGALESGGAFVIENSTTGEVLGSTRFYDYDTEDSSVFIGYTFYKRSAWGKGVNPQVKRMMLSHAFKWVDKVKFHVGKFNHRSVVAMTRLGAKVHQELEVAYHGEAPKINLEFWIEKKNFDL